MPRSPRNYLKTSFFHVLVQGINKSYIFNNEEEIKKYLKIINQYKEEKDIKIIAYCIMNNHAHILVEVEKIEKLASFMHAVNTKYAMYYNKKHKRVGYVFRDRYKSEGIYTEKQFYNCIEYIHNNPVKAKMCTKPMDYKFSSARYMKNNKVSSEDVISFLDIEEEYVGNITNMIDDFLKKEKITKDYLIRDKTKLKELLIILRRDNKISYRKIENEINISRETLRSLFNKEKL